MPQAAGLGGPALLVDETGTPLGSAGNPLAFTAAPAGAATIADGTDVCEGAIADAAATAGGTGTVSAKLRVISGTLGAVADAAATAGSTGSLAAKLRTVTAQLDTLNTTMTAILAILTDVHVVVSSSIKTSS